MIGFAGNTVVVVSDWGFGGELETPATTGDKSGVRGSGFLDLGVQPHPRFSWALRPTSQVVTDIRPRWVINKDMSTLQFARGLSFLVDVVN